MPSWDELLHKMAALNDQEAGNWLQAEQKKAMAEIGRLRSGRHVIFYASAFLQKPQTPAPLIQLTHEDINGFMTVVHGMDWNKGLVLLLHTPGGLTNAAETVVAYLRSKFESIEVIIPTYAMSAGTMVSLASDLLVMGRQSQLGPIDPQFIIGGRSYSARAIVDQFAQAKSDIIEDRNTAHLWAPVLQTIGPALLQEARNALDYGERMVADWLARYMLKNRPESTKVAKATAKHFNDASKHKSHGRRIDRDEARANNVVVEDLEDSQELQEQVMTAYHLTTLAFEKSPAVKALGADTERFWIKNWGGPGGPHRKVGSS